MTAEIQAPPPSASVPQDANDLRCFHFRRLMKKGLTIGLGGAFVLAVGIGLAAATKPIIGLAAAGGALLIVFIVVFVIADSKAEDDFFRAYATARGLQWSDSRGSLPPVTALLRKGDARYTEMTLTGQLPSGPNGVLAHYTYEEETTDSDGNRQTSYYHFTVVYCELPQLAQFVQELVCHRRSGFRFMDSTEDKFRKRHRVELESEAFDKHFESFAGEHDDLNRVRQIYEPTFIVWLAEQAPKNFEWDIVGGSLMCSVKGQLDSTAELDGMCAAAGVVAKRLFDEAGESFGSQATAPTGA
jgi:hypothetical protein